MSPFLPGRSVSWPSSIAAIAAQSSDGVRPKLGDIGCANAAKGKAAAKITSLARLIIAPLPIPALVQFDLGLWFCRNRLVRASTHKIVQNTQVGCCVLSDFLASEIVA